MSAPYFYEPQINLGATSFTCSEETSKHCAQVLRMQGGDAIQITNGMGGVFEATIVGQVFHDGGLPIINRGFQICKSPTFVGWNYFRFISNIFDILANSNSKHLVFNLKEIVRPGA